MTAYAKAIVSRRLPSNELQRLACQRHLDDLKRFKAKSAPFQWDLEWAVKKLAFFPQLIHWRGALVGQPFELMAWQEFCAGCLFGWFKADGTYRFETAYISVPKKSGKSVFVGAIALLRGFFDGEAGAETYSVATTREQANIVWTEARELIRKSQNPRIRALSVFDGRRNIHDAVTRSKFEPLSADKDSGDGKNPYCLIADEVHRYRDAELLNMLQESMATRENRLTVEITTAGWDRNSICYEHDEYSQNILKGLVTDDTWFAFICRADDADRDHWDEPEVWERANPSYGVAIHEDRVETAARQAGELPSKLNDFLRYRLNIWTEQHERAIDLPKWEESGQNSPKMDDLRGARCFGGLDLASNRDLVAFVLVFPDRPRAGQVAALMWLWCPEEGVLKRSKEDKQPYDRWVRGRYMKATSGDTTDYRVVREDVLGILEHFDLGAIGFDPHNSGNVPHELADVLGSNRVIKIYQGAKSMAAPIKEIERLYFAGDLKHGNNPALNWMANNATWKVNEYNERRFDRQKSSEKIDGMVALAMAVGVWINHQDSDLGESVYDREQRGIEIF